MANEHHPREAGRGSSSSSRLQHRRDGQWRRADPPLTLAPLTPPLSPTFSELCASSSDDDLSWAFEVIAAASPRGPCRTAGAGPGAEQQGPTLTQLRSSTGRTAVLPPPSLRQQSSSQPYFASCSGRAAASAPAWHWGHPRHLPNSLRIMLQLLGGPTVQPPERRAPAVCNLTSRFKHVEGRRRKDQTESWRARLRRNGSLYA